MRASENEALDDEDKLELKWETMDDGAEIFGEAEKKKVYRTFAAINPS